MGPNVTFANDPFPRSRQWLPEHPKTVVRRGASIGAGAVILPGLTIGQGAMIGAGAVVTRNVPPHAVVTGNPARIQRYITEGRPEGTQPTQRATAAQEIFVRGVKLADEPVFRDMRGSLVARQAAGGSLPFVPARLFWVFDVPSKEVRGEHAHRVCEQLLICTQGSVLVVVDDGEHRQEVLLDHPARSLYIPPMVWGVQYAYSQDAVLLVAASHPYDASDYIRDYDEFLRLARGA